MRNFERLIERYGGTQPVTYAGERWGNEMIVDLLGNLYSTLQDMPGYDDEGTTVIGGYDRGDPILIESFTGNVILRLASEEDMEDQ